MRSIPTQLKYVTWLSLTWSCLLSVSCASSPQSSPTVASPNTPASVLTQLGAAGLREPSVDRLDTLFSEAERIRIERASDSVRWIGQDSGIEFSLVPDSAAPNATKSLVAALVWQVSTTRPTAFAILRDWLGRLGEARTLEDDGASNLELSIKPKASTARLTARLYKSSKGWENAVRIDWRSHAAVQCAAARSERFALER